MCFIFSVPKEIVMIILSDWIDVFDLALFDSAVCRHDTRPQFLAILSSDHFLQKRCEWSDIDSPCTKFVKWLAKREVRTSKWAFTFNLAPSLIAELVNRTGGPHVTSLELFNVGEGTAAILVALASVKCPNISYIRVWDCLGWMFLTALTTEGQLSLREFVIDGCDTRYAIDFSGCCFPNLLEMTIGGLTGEFLSDSLASFIRAAPNVTNFSLKCLSFGDTVLRALSCRAESLDVIHLKDCDGYTDTALCSLACECTNLRSVHLDSWEGDRQFSAIVVQTFAVRCRHLEGVQLHFVCTQDTLNQLTVHGGARLRYLSLRTAEFDNDAGLLTLADRCKHLQELALMRCYGFTADGLAQLLSSLKDLKELVIGNCDVVTDTVLIAIATHLPQLQVLQLYDCEGYTTAGALVLIRSLKHINHFSESSAHMFTGDRTVFTNDLMTQWKETAPHLNAPSGRFRPHSTSYFWFYRFL
jgi:hypothetical protein